MSKNISFDFLIVPLEIAKSNKEVLTCLLVLDAGIETQENEKFEAFIANNLKSNNATIKVETVKYTLNSPLLKATFNTELITLKAADKNPYVRSILEEKL